MFWGIDIQPLFIMNRLFLLLHCSNQIRKMRNQSKVSGPELNHYYISYSDIQIQYRWNRGNGPLISLDHVRIRRPVESSCSWMLHKKNRYSFPPPRKVHSKSTRAIFLFFYGNAMQEVGNLVVSDDEKFLLCEIDENPKFESRQC